MRTAGCPRLVFVLFVVVAVTPDIVASSELQIVEPPEWQRDGGYPHTAATFGFESTKGNLTAAVYYADGAELCDPNVDTSGGIRALPIEDEQQPFVLLVDRGYCTFVSKVRSAQRAGASAVIVIDSQCLCEDVEAGEVCAPNDGVSCQQVAPVMGDDGSGSDIQLPSFLIRKQDGDAIADRLRMDLPVVMQLSWGLVASSDPEFEVEYTLWTDPTDATLLSQFRLLAEISAALAPVARFSPRQFVFDGVTAGCRERMTGENRCGNLCINEGRYCFTDPDSDGESGISGADVTTESLRRICIWNEYREEDEEANNNGMKWWNYMDAFQRRCYRSGTNRRRFSKRSCIGKAMDVAGIDRDRIEKCMEDSGGIKFGPNALLDAEISDQERMRIVVIPTVLVNGSAVRSTITAAQIFATICSAFSPTSQPKICGQCVACASTGDAPSKRLRRCIRTKGRRRC